MKTSKLFMAIGIIVISNTCTQCITIFLPHSDFQTITIKSVPAGASFSVGDNHGTTPTSIKINRRAYLDKGFKTMKQEDFVETIIFEKSGYPVTKHPITIRGRGWLWGPFYRFPNSVNTKLDTWQDRIDQFQAGDLNAFAELKTGMAKREVDSVAFWSKLLQALKTPSQDHNFNVIVCRYIAGNYNDRVLNEIKSILHTSDQKSLAISAMAIGMIGGPAKETAPVLLEKFPVLEVTFSTKWGPFNRPNKYNYVDKYGTAYGPPNKINPLPDPNIITEKEQENQTNVESIFSSYQKKITHDIYHLTEPGVYYTLLVEKYNIYTGAWALSNISGMDLGINKETWLNYFKKAF